MVCPPKVRPSLETVKACWNENPHGGGVAWREGGKVAWVKLDTAEEMFRAISAAHGKVIAHFRIASVGGVKRELRHPFPVSKRAGLASKGHASAVLFQNGTWLEWKAGLKFAAEDGHQIPDGMMSDARAAAFLVSIYGVELLAEMKPSRWVYFSATETKLFGAWTEVDGIKYSNTAWRSRVSLVSIDDHDGIEAAIGRMKKLDEEREIARQKANRLLGRDTPPECGCGSELFSLNGVDNYWEKLRNECPKPTKTLKPLTGGEFKSCHSCGRASQAASTACDYCNSPF